MIGTNKKDAADTVARILEDEEAGTLGAPAEPDADAIAAWLAERAPDAVTWEGWQAIDAAENAAGEAQGRPRVKLVTLAELREAGRLAPALARPASRAASRPRPGRAPGRCGARRRTRGTSTSQAAGLEQLARAPRERDVHDRVVAAVGDERARVRRSASEGCQPSTVGTKPEKARMPAGAGRSGPSPSA